MRHAGATAAPGAIVIGGDYRGLGIVRSLGRRRIPVWVLCDDHQLARFSRFARGSSAWPTESSDAARTAYLLHLAAAHRLDGWALFPTGDETAAFVARHHDQLSQCFRLTTPPWQVLRWAYDKRLTYGLAARMGLDYPWTRYPRDRAVVAGLPCPFPVIVKPALKPEANALTVAKAWRANDREELVARYDAACQLMDSRLLMIQELIPGGGEAQLSFGALCLAGKPLARVVARRVRQWPMDFGRASTYVETIDDPDVEAEATRLLGAIRYTGLVEVEFKRDPRDGKDKLLDVNPRVWGWHTLGQRAGVDFSYLQWQQARGDSVVPGHASAGTRWVRLTTDLATAGRELLRGQLSPAAYVRSLRSPLEHATFAVDDPLPALVEVPLMALEPSVAAVTQRARLWIDSLQGRRVASTP